MQKITVLLFSLIFFNSIYSQDVITKKNGDEINAKIIEVTQSEIKYKKFSNINGPTFIILKDELLMIKYEDGTKEVLNQVPSSVVTSINNTDLRQKGIDDANMNYKGKKSGAGWVAATTILTSPLIGLIPAAICSSNEPAESNLNIQDKDLKQKSEYKAAYVEQAHKIKKRKIWSNFGIGSGVWFLIILLL